MIRLSYPILFRCDGSTTNGMGHVMRCLAVADELRGKHGIASAFALRLDDTGAQLIERNNYRVFRPESDIPFNYRTWLTELSAEARAKALVLDVRDDLQPAILAELRRSGLLLVDIDDPCHKRLHVDLAFYPPVPQIERMEWKGFGGQLYIGWDWIPLRREFKETPVRLRSEPVTRVLLTAGGADPTRITERVVQFLDSIETGFEIVVVVGPAFRHQEEVERLIARSSGSFRIEKDPVSLPALMETADIAITSFGVTAYELAAKGVPAIYLCLTEDHQESASALAANGMGISLGLSCEIEAVKLLNALKLLLESPDLRLRMSQTARLTMDGRGAERISDLIVDNLEKGSK